MRTPCMRMLPLAQQRGAGERMARHWLGWLSAQHGSLMQLGLAS